MRWKCVKCGRVHEGTEAPESCPTCAHPRGWFVPIEANF
ncbi:MAG: rubredoxin-like domain-containing protein [Verrucomicrobiota bacterium]